MYSSFKAVLQVLFFFFFSIFLEFKKKNFLCITNKPFLQFATFFYLTVSSSDLVLACTSLLSSILQAAGVFVERLFYATRGTNLLPFSRILHENNSYRLENCFSQVIHHSNSEDLICFSFSKLSPRMSGFSCQGGP